MDGMYLSRFMRNREPLLTPRLQKLALRDPMIMSRQMLAAVDELQEMLQAHEEGRQVAKDAIIEKVREIRELAKDIRGDDLLPFVDQRKDMDTLKGKNIKSMGFRAVEELRAMVVDLNGQLANLFDQASTATISVSTLRQPSFSSMSKGIEKLCKVIESSAKRI